MPSSGYVEVLGLAEFRKQLKAIDANLPKELRRNFRTIAENVASRVRAKVPKRSGEAAGAIKVNAGQGWAGVSRPRATAPWQSGAKGAYYNWLDWGGTTGRGHTIGGAGGAIRRPFQKGDGRYLYPTIREMRPEIREQALEALNDAAKKAGVTVHFG